ncbi:MAG: hypothetical protein ACI8TQ_000548 [Planctomycetota bacterium]|jgi:hypothetical protein
MQEEQSSYLNRPAMNKPATPNLREVLDCSSALELTMDDIATNIPATSWMHCLLERDGEGQQTTDRTTDAKDGAYPRLFIDFESLQEHATASTQVGSDHSFECRTETWLSSLMRLWQTDAPGFTLDAGGGIALDLDRSNISALIMAFAVEWFVSPSNLCIVMRQGRVYYHTNEAGMKQAFVFTSRGSAYDNLARMRESIPSLVVAPVDPSLALEGTLGAGVDRLIVDPGLPDERCFNTADLKTIRELRLGQHHEDQVVATAESFKSSEVDERDDERLLEIATETTATTATTPDNESASDISELIDGGESAEHELVFDGLEAELDPSMNDFLGALVPTEAEIEASEAPSARTKEPEATSFHARYSQDEAHEKLLQIKTLADSEPENTWRATELYATELDFWVPFIESAPTQKDWPHVVNVADGAGQNTARTSIYTSEAEASQSLARGNETCELIPFVGVEAFRWIWSSPQNAVEILIDPHAGDGGVKLHRNSIPSMLFPTILGIKDLSQVREVETEHLGAIQGVHGLKAEVIRAMALNWSQLLGPPMTASQTQVNYDGGSYLPVFTDDAKYQAYVRASGAKLQRPIQPQSEPPFMNWLRLAGRCDGVVLNPTADGANDGKTLTLNASELFHLHLWAQNMSQPDGAQVVLGLANLQKGDYAADQSICGQIAADWPLYIGAVSPAGAAAGLVKVPGTDDLALFSGERELMEFKRTFRTEDASIDEIQAHHMLPRWRSSFFNLANQQYSGVCINPGSGATPKGVRLDGKGLDGAIGRLDQRLRPNLPSFRPASE